MLNVLHIYILASEASEFFFECTQNMQKMFTLWSVILDSAEFFWRDWKLWGIFPQKVPG